MNLLSSIGNGLGRLGTGFQNLQTNLGNNLFPVDPTMAGSVDPATLATQRRLALMRLGLGLSGASAQGAPIGTAAIAGLGQAIDPFERFVTTAYTNTTRKRLEDKADSRYQAERDYKIQQDQQEQNRWESQQAAAERRQQLELDAQKTWHEATLKIEREKLADARGRNAFPSAPAGYRYTAGGSLEYVPGGPADPAIINKGGKLTEQEQKAVSQVSRMSGAEQTLGKLGYQPTLYAQGTAAVPLVGNMLTPEKNQSYQQAAREWISGLLRFDSGAAVPETEFKRYFNTYFPQPGDGQDVIAQKSIARERARQSIENGLSPVANNRIGLGGQVDGQQTGGLGQLIAPSGQPRQFSPDVAARARGYMQ